MEWMELYFRIGVYVLCIGSFVLGIIAICATIQTLKEINNKRKNKLNK